jgi:hypothetical protein
MPKEKRGGYLVLGFIPDDDPAVTGKPRTGHGAHTPLRSDGYYADPPHGIAKAWREYPIHPRERVAVVQVMHAPGEESGPT